MGFIKLIISLTLIFSVSEVKSQSLLSGLQGLDRQLPVFGACDRIASRGVMNCLQNFLPTSLLSGLSSGQSSGGLCCNYGKYKACINGLHDGLRFAMERERCPKSYSARIIKSLGDSSVGSPVKSLCRSDGGTNCGRTAGTRKKTKKSSKRTQPPDESSSILEPILQPARDIFSRFTHA